MKRSETYGHVKDGILKIHYLDKFMDQVRSFGDCRVRVICEKIYKKRSTITDNGLGQNGYYWGIIIPEYINGAWAEQRRTLTIEQAHEELLANCSFEEKYNEETGTVMRTILRTSQMSTVQAEEYFQRCRGFILEWFGITVPLPGEQADLFETKEI